MRRTKADEYDIREHQNPSSETMAWVEARRRVLQKIIDTSDDKDKVEWAKDKLDVCVAL